MLSEELKILVFHRLEERKRLVADILQKLERADFLTKQIREYKKTYFEQKEREDLVVQQLKDRMKADLEALEREKRGENISNFLEDSEKLKGGSE